MDDVNILTAIVKGELGLHKQLFVCLEQNSLSGYCQVNSRSTAMAFYDEQNFSAGIPKETLKCFMYKEEL